MALNKNKINCYYEKEVLILILIRFFDYNERNGIFGSVGYGNMMNVSAPFFSQ